MGNYRQIFYQVVFGTKQRRPTIDETHCSELYQYISGIIKNKNCKLFAMTLYIQPLLGLLGYLYFWCRELYSRLL